MIIEKSFLYADLVLNKHFLLLSMLKTIVLLNIFVKAMILFFIIWLIKSKKLHHLFETEINCEFWSIECIITE